MAHETENTTGRQARAIAALLAQPTIEQAAEAVGIGPRTLFRWLQQPGFQDAYREARRQSVSQAIAQLQQASAEAVKALRDVMNNPKAGASARVSAAKVVLETALRGIELEDLERRVEALENPDKQDINHDSQRQSITA